jgi:hypothetical protein
MLSKITICLLWLLHLHAAQYVAAMAVNYILPSFPTKQRGCLNGILWESDSIVRLYPDVTCAKGAGGSRASKVWCAGNNG